MTGTTGKDGLEEYRVPLNYVTPYFDGVYLAVNAIPDAYLVYDAHNCGYHKAEKIAGSHDLFSDLLRWDRMNRVVRTNIESREYIMGSDDKLSMKLRQVHERYQPEVIFVARSNIVMIAGTDASMVVRDLQERFQVPLVLIPDHSVEHDYLTGYLSTVTEFLNLLPFEGARDGETVVTLAGHLFDRHEGDQIGNVQELTRMLVGLGVRPGGVLLDGSPMAELRKLPRPDWVVDLAYDWDGAARLADRVGAQYLSSGLPLGLQGTQGWIERLGATLGVEDRAEEYVDRELREIVPQLEWMLPRYFVGRSVMIFADRLLLPHLSAFVSELGCHVSGVGCTSVSYVRGAAGASSHAIDSAPHLPLVPGELEAAVEEAQRNGEVDLIIGNSLLRQILAHTGIPFVELGYPANFHHCLHPAPYLGFGGVRVLVERMINAMEEGNLRRPGGK